MAFEALVDLFARTNLQYPRMIFNHPHGPHVTLRKAGLRSKYPGTINVTNGQSYSEGLWYGRIHKDGRFEKSLACTPAILSFLQKFAADPARVAADYGKLTGHCCFCGLRLTDGRSTEVGYGHICAENYGLPWGGV